MDAEPAFYYTLIFIQGLAMNLRNVARQASIVIFGVIFPVYVLFQAYQGVAGLQNNVSYNKTLTQLVADFADAKKNIDSVNDYALFSLMYVEHGNQKTMINKQTMKAAIVHIGFAVMSIGMMLLILGINNGGIEGSAGTENLKFDFKTGSTGIAVFVIGSVMATVGGILKNEYSSSTIPMYEGAGNEQYAKSVNAYKSCFTSKSENPEKCFAGIFEQINRSNLK